MSARLGFVCKTVTQAAKAAEILLAGRRAKGSVFDIDGTLLQLLVPSDAVAVGAQPGKVVAPLPEHFRFLRLAADHGCKRIHVVTARSESAHNRATTRRDLSEIGVVPFSLGMMDPIGSRETQLDAKTRLRAVARRYDSRREDSQLLLNVGDRITDIVDHEGMVHLCREAQSAGNWFSETVASADDIIVAESMRETMGRVITQAHACKMKKDAYVVMTGYDTHSMVQIKVPSWSTGLL